MSCTTESHLPKTRDGHGHAVPRRNRVPAPLARRGALDEAHSTLLRRWVRLCVRILCAIFFITLPLVPNDNATFDIGVNTGFLALIVVAETVGKISFSTPLGDRPESGARRARSRRASGSRTRRRAKSTWTLLRVRVRTDR